MMRGELVTVFGGSGFIGRYVVRRLAQEGWQVRVAVRRPDEALFLKTAGHVGQVTPVAANVRDQASVRAAVSGATAVINLVGILFQAGPQRFDAVHAQGAANVASAAAAAGVRAMVHISAIGADPQSSAAYARSKAAGEAGVTKAFPAATIFRPSIVFGPEDDFFNRFAKMALIAPALPLIGGGTTRFQPVYVGDVARAMLRALDDPATHGKAYELCGPRQYRLKELVEYVCQLTGHRRLVIGLPDRLSYWQAAILERMPGRLMTRDNYRSMQAPSVCSGSFPFGIEPQPLEAIAPTYLAPSRPRERYPQLRYRARR
jgi:NADH dehydrogenase